jgi:hypothetical protein
MKEIKFNFNDDIKVKLNSSGIEIMREHYNDLFNSIAGLNNKYLKEHPFTEPKKDENGYTSFQLHSFMAEFGQIGMGEFNQKQPFETDILICVED